MEKPLFYVLDIDHRLPGNFPFSVNNAPFHWGNYFCLTINVILVPTIAQESPPVSWLQHWQYASSHSKKSSSPECFQGGKGESGSLRQGGRKKEVLRVASGHILPCIEGSYHT